jgi:hypothetical protein
MKIVTLLFWIRCDAYSAAVFFSRQQRGRCLSQQTASQRRMMEQSQRLDVRASRTICRLSKMTRHGGSRARKSGKSSLQLCRTFPLTFPKNGSGFREVESVLTASLILHGISKGNLHYFIRTSWVLSGP